MMSRPVRTGRASGRRRVSVRAATFFCAPLAALSLAACASAPRERVVVKEVRVPVTTPCKVDVPASEPLAGDTVDLGSNVFELVKAVLIDRERLLAERDTLRAAVEGCG